MHHAPVTHVVDPVQVIPPPAKRELNEITTAAGAAANIRTSLSYIVQKRATEKGDRRQAYSQKSDGAFKYHGDSWKAALFVAGSRTSKPINKTK